MVPGQRAHHLITREELSEEIASYGKKMTPNDLRYWESQGVIPRSIKKRHKGATRAVYPDWMTNVVLFGRILQERGESLEEIAETLKTLYRKNLDGTFPSTKHPDIAALNDRRLVFDLAGRDSFLSASLVSQVNYVLSDVDMAEVEYVDLRIVGRDGKTIQSARWINRPSDNAGTGSDQSADNDG